MTRSLIFSDVIFLSGKFRFFCENSFRMFTSQTSNETLFEQSSKMLEKLITFKLIIVFVAFAAAESFNVPALYWM